MTDDHANPSAPIKLAHGTTTLAFRFKDGIVRVRTPSSSIDDGIRISHGEYPLM
jgi:hypothetical protein